MDISTISIILIVFAVFLILGMPIAICMGWATLIYFLMLPTTKFILMLPSGMFQGIDSFVIMAVPFFILAGEFMNAFGITDRLMKFAEEIGGNIRGSLAYANILGSFLFAGITGAAVSDVAALGSIEIPAMEKQGYDKPFAAALTAASSLVGPIIPPSIIMVIYGSIMGVSIAGLFAAGIIPGVLFCFVDFSYVYFISKKRNYPIRPERTTLKGILLATRSSAFALFMPIIIIGGILGGIFTPTEAATVAAVYAFILGITIYRNRFSLKTLKECLLNAGVKSSYIFLIIAVAVAFKWVLAVLNIPTHIITLLTSISTNKWVIITMVNLFFLFVGMFFETGAACILFGPIFAPIMVKMGFDPLHFGIVMVVNLCIGLCTPPLGVCLYGACSISGVTLEEISKEVLPFVVLNIMVLAFITYLPGVALWLPRLIGF
jgi:TRAP-type transport system large permease protein